MSALESEIIQKPAFEEVTGRIALRSDGSTTSFTELSATYPLKLLSPRISHQTVAVVYILSYGGGLVGGDIIRLSVDVDKGSVLVALSQVWRRIAI
jgi:urease accessory protein